MAEQHSILVYGGGGALGRAIVSLFRQKNHHVISCDIVRNDEANDNIAVQGVDMSADAQTIKSKLSNSKLDAVFCAAGGWSGGNIADPETFAAVDRMWKFNVQSAVTAAHIAAHHLKPSGLLVFMGACAALQGTPGMIGYGISKAATHHLVSSLSGADSHLASGVSTIAILPVTLDTPSNRSGMPKEDFGNWTPVDEVAKKLHDWFGNANNRPPSGSLIEVKTNAGVTQWTSVQITLTKHNI